MKLSVASKNVTIYKHKTALRLFYYALCFANEQLPLYINICIGIASNFHFTIQILPTRVIKPVLIIATFFYTATTRSALMEDKETSKNPSQYSMACPAKALSLTQPCLLPIRRMAKSRKPGNCSTKWLIEPLHRIMQ